MSKPILLSKIAINQLDSLPNDIRNRVKKALYVLNDAENSRILDTKKLKGISGRENLFRLRIENWQLSCYLF